MDRIPVVDMGALSTESGRVPCEEDWRAIAAEVDNVLSAIGFVYLKNHGIPQETIERAFMKSLEFFGMPFETKKKFQKKGGRDVFGYVEPNQEMLEPGKPAPEIRESFDISLKTIEEMESGELIPDAPGFCTALATLTLACHPVIEKLHRILARALDLQDLEYFNKVSRVFTDKTSSSYTTFRSIFYPPIPEDVLPGTVRCAQHSDYGTLTLLFQDGMGGLEVQNADGVWVAANPIPGTILVNTGDLLYFWSGKRYPATIHRVLIPEIETKKRLPRQSIAYFVHPDDGVMVSPIGPLADTKVNALPVSAYEHTRMRIEKSYKY